MDRVGNEKLSAMNIVVPVAANVTINEAEIVAINTDGYAVPASKAEGMTVAGCSLEYVDNATGSDGDTTVHVRRGTFVWNNDGTIKETDILKSCYVSDKNTVTLTAEGSSKAGTILAVDPDGVTVDMTTAQ